ncbi:MAG: transglutaminase-like domain-containing protein [Anaerolineales bacterium]
MNGLLERPLAWIVGQLGWQNMLVWSLLLVILSSISLGLAETVNGLETTLVWSLASLGLLVGWLLARSKISGISAAGLAVASGAAATLWRVGHLGGSLSRLVLAMNELVLQVMHWRPGSPALDLSLIEQTFLDVVERILVLFTRSAGWLAALVHEPMFDPVAASLVWGLLIWLVGLWAGWATRRYWKPIAAVLPGAALLAISLAYSGQPTVLLIAVLAASLFLMAVLSYARNERHWKSEAIDYSEDIRVELALLTIPLVLSLTMLAALSPSLSIQKLSQAIQEFKSAHQPARDTGDGQNPSLGESLGLKARPPVQRQDVFANMRAGGMPRQHLLGTGAELNEQVVMLIRTGELPPGPPESVTAKGVPRYYWRSITYDRYSGRGWLTSATDTQGYPAGQPAVNLLLDGQIQLPPSQKLVHQDVRTLQDLNGLLYTAGTPVEVDQDYQIARRRVPQSGADATTGGDIFGASVEETKYQAISLYPVAGPQALRQAGSAYPDWLLDRYLALPEALPARVRSLGVELTTGGRTPYDRALAIESYLRQNYPYTLDLPTPPSNRDLVDYFLFDLRKGYCDYYASAMVVLARSAGLPARLATGFASGSYDALNARYVVTAAQAHSWPEIYFPGFGWVPFEPTAAQPALNRPEQGGEAILPDLGNPVPVPELTGLLNWSRLLFWTMGLASFLIAALLFLSMLDLWRLSRLSPVEATHRIFISLSRQAWRLNIHLKPGDTPLEFSQALQNQVARFLEDTRWHSTIGPAQGEVHQIVNLYTRAIYSPHPPGKTEQQHAIRAWRRLRWRLRLAGWMSSWPLRR